MLVTRTVTTLVLVLVLCCIPLCAQTQCAPFAIVSDTHMGAQDSLYPAIRERIREEQITVIIHTGDAIHARKVGNWDTFFATQETGATLHLAPGNNDISGKASFEAYLKRFPRSYYSFSDGDTLFILLNTEIPGEESTIQDRQRAWLEEELRRPFRYKFVFLHKPLFPVIVGHGLDRDAKARDALHRLFVQNNVSLVVSGHDHIYQRSVLDGIVYVIMPATLGNTPPFMGNGAPRYVVATRTNERYSFVVKDVRGAVTAEFFVTDNGYRRSHSFLRSEPIANLFRNWGFPVFSFVPVFIQ